MTMGEFRKMTADCLDSVEMVVNVEDDYYYAQEVYPVVNQSGATTFENCEKIVVSNKKFMEMVIYIDREET